MNGEVIKEFLVGLGFEVDQASLGKFNDGLKKATLSITAIGAAATAAAGFVVSFVADIANQFDALGDLSNRINTTAEEIMRLGYVATLTGSSVAAANASLEGLNRTAGEAALGIGRGSKIFEDLGLKARDSNGKLKNTAVLMSEISTRIKDMERGEQLAVLSKLGIDATMIKALTTDISGLSAEFDALYKAAGVDANKAAEQADEFNDSMDRLKMTFDAIKSAVGLKFMKQIRNGIETLRKFLVENMPKIINAVSPIIEVVLRIAVAFIKIVARIGSAIGAILGFLAKVNDATNGWAGYLLAAAAAWRYLNLAFLATPIGIIISLAVALGLLIDDFLTFLEGGDSLIDWGGIFEKVMAGARDILDAFVSWFESAAAAIISIFSGVKDWFEKFFAWLFDKFDAVKNFIGTIAGTVAGAAGKVSGAVSNAWRSAQGLVGGANDNRPPLAPSPQAAAAVTGGQQTVSQKTDIVVQGASNPDVTARAVASQQNRVNADMVRNMKGAAR